MKVSLVDREGKILFQNPSYVFREQYQVSQELSSFFEEDSPALAGYPVILPRPWSATSWRASDESLYPGGTLRLRGGRQKAAAGLRFRGR